MSTPMNPAMEFERPRTEGARSLAPIRPLYWSIRRELWENHSIIIAPLVAACVGLLIFILSLFHRSRHMDPMTAFNPDRPIVDLAMPYSHIAMLVIFTAFLVGIFYSLDALHGERRDRSILFWKSLPVSDLTTVLSKALVPLAVLPLCVFVITVATQLVMLLLHTVVVAISGGSVGALLSRLPLFQMQGVLLYTVVVLALWHAPLYMWFLLISGWVRRAAFLWAVLPPLAACIIEALAFHSHHLGTLLRVRLIGFATNAFNLHLPDGGLIDPHLIPTSQLTPAVLLSSPALWAGLFVAAALLAASIRLRRYRDPV